MRPCFVLWSATFASDTPTAIVSCVRNLDLPHLNWSNSFSYEMNRLRFFFQISACPA